MSRCPEGHHELYRLLEAACEDRLSAEEQAGLESLLIDNAEARQFYRDYMHLHGTLYWDTAVGFDSSSDLPVYAMDLADAPTVNASVTTPPPPAPWKSWGMAAASLAALSLLIGLFALYGPGKTSLQTGPLIAGNDPVASPASDPVDHDQPNTPKHRSRPEIPLISTTQPKNPEPDKTENEPAVTPEGSDSTIARGSSDESILEFLNTRLSDGWKANEIEPSPYASDAEWLRRVFLDIVGHIPSAREAQAFLEDDHPRKRERLLEDLLDRPEYVRNWSTIWANLMVGRSPERAEFRESLLKFLRDSFRENRPWDEMVAAVVSAEGSIHDNAASGYLLAHVNNQAVPATAITARLFLGTNVQCTQCHDHPFNDAKQNQFWELNSFFKQTERREIRRLDPETGQTLVEVALVSRDHVEGPTFYEDRQGLVKPAYPIFNGKQISDNSKTNRRGELARLLSAGEKPRIAEAMVNRLWKHFYGAGFTSPVDDMGPHNPVSHPEVLDRLAREFVQSGYDQKRLMKWICLSDGYLRTSRTSDANEIDNPELGEIPLFSRVYLKTMSAEQLYDSLLVATGVIHSLKGDWNVVEQQRDDWLAQFVHAYQNDENAEETHFSGTISQALMMMNGDLIEQALSYQPGTYLREIANENGSEQDKIKQLCLAALTRKPTSQETAAIRKLLAKSISRSDNRQQALAAGLQDVFWAYLNSSEFAVIH